MPDASERWILRIGLAMQWISVLMVFFAGNVMSATFARFGMSLPVVTRLSLWLSQSLVLLSIATITTTGLIIMRRALKSEQARHVVHIIHLCFWLGLISFVLVALSFPFMEDFRIG